MSNQFKQTTEKSQTVELKMEPNECELNANKIIGWNINNAAESSDKMNLPCFLSEVEVSHKRITERFMELLNLFEDYSKIMESEHAQHNPQPKLKRTQSEQFTAGHTTAEHKGEGLLKTTASLNHMQLSESTLRAEVSTVTCEMSSQTCWKELKEMPKKTLELDSTKVSQNELHTLHIEVDSVSSNTALERAPLRQRLWLVMSEAARALVSAVYMMGENFTYVLFVVLCLWCLYLILVHYYSFVGASANEQQLATKKSLLRIRTSAK